MIVPDNHSPAKIELTGRKRSVFARKVVIESKRQLGGVACRCVLLRIGQAGGIAIEGAPHPELLGLAVHAFGESRLASGETFRQHRGGIVGRASDDAEYQILNVDRIARPQTELSWRLARRLDADRQILIEP